MSDKPVPSLQIRRNPDGTFSASKNTLTSNGTAGGIQTGYNWRWGNVVAGIEGDVTFMCNNANVTVGLPPPSQQALLPQTARLD